MASSPAKLPRQSGESTRRGKLVGALDQGTSSTRFMVFDEKGQPVCVAQREHTQILPFQGGVEHDPDEIWERTCDVIRECLASGGLTARDLSCVGITNQRETTVVWNRATGKPYANAVVWMDMRAQAVCDDLELRGLKAAIRDKTGLPLSPYFSGTKIRWLLDHVPGLREAAERGEAVAGTVDSWLLYKLSGGARAHLTDVTNASRYMLMDLAAQRWDDALCEQLGVPKRMLPEIRSSSEVYFAAAEPAELRGVLVAGVLGDQQAALVGQCALRPGMAKSTYGTGLFILMNTGERPVASTHGLLTTVAYKLGPSAPTVFALEGSVAIGGALVQWLRDNLNLFASASEVEALAREVPDNGGVYIVPAFSGLYAPYWRPDARGIICGLTRFANRRHLARAALEATAFQTLDVFEAMCKDAGVPLAALAVDGGMSRNDLLLEFQADVARCKVVRPKMTETTALGACFAAGLAVGVWRDLDQLERAWPGVDRDFVPSMSESEREKRVAAWRRAVEKSFNSVAEE